MSLTDARRNLIFRLEKRTRLYLTLTINTNPKSNSSTINWFKFKMKEIHYLRHIGNLILKSWMFRKRWLWCYKSRRPYKKHRLWHRT